MKPLRLATEDHFPLALFVATVLHALVILGVSFAPALRDSPPPLPTLDITLVTQKSAQAPEDAQFLAQANQEGGGDSETRERPRPQASAIPIPPTPPASPEATPETAPQQLVQAGDEVPLPAEQQTPSAASLVREGLAMAADPTLFGAEARPNAPRPREKHISPRTREYKYAAYMDAWVEKVERIGNLNYPDEARRQKLSGGLLLDVALNTDGSVHTITLLRSSGEVVLDEAAARIVRLSAPFAPFPAEISKDTDILHIIRTWEFQGGNRLMSR
jgi:protein TonB